MQLQAGKGMALPPPSTVCLSMGLVLLPVMLELPAFVVTRHKHCPATWMSPQWGQALGVTHRAPSACLARSEDSANTSPAVGTDKWGEGGSETINKSARKPEPELPPRRSGLMTSLVSVAVPVQSLAQCGGLRIRRCCHCGVGHRCMFGFGCWPRNFGAPWVWLKKEKKKNPTT